MLELFIGIVIGAAVVFGLAVWYLIWFFMDMMKRW